MSDDLLNITQLDLGFFSRTAIPLKSQGALKILSPCPVHCFSKCGAWVFPLQHSPGCLQKCSFSGSPSPPPASQNLCRCGTKGLIYFLCIIKSETLGFLGLQLLKLVMGPYVSGTFLQIRIISSSGQVSENSCFIIYSYHKLTIGSGSDNPNYGKNITFIT